MQAQTHVTERRLLSGFVAAIAAVVLSFLAAFAATFVASREIDQASAELVTDALPSIAELVRTRTALRRLDIHVGVLTAARTGYPLLIDEIAAARTEVEATLRAAMSTSKYPDARELYDGEIAPHLKMLDDAIDTLRTAALPPDGGGDGRFVSAMWQVDASAKEVDASVAPLQELVRAHSSEIAERIGSAHVRAVQLTLILAAAAVMVGVAAAAVALQSGRRYASESRATLGHETERANELDLVAQQIAHDIVSPLSAVALSLSAIRRAHDDVETTRIVDRAWRALERSRQMVQGVYEFARAGAYPVAKASAPLRASVEKAVEELLCAEAESPPTIDVEPFEEVDVAMDRALLGVVLSNLLSNAAKFTRCVPVRRITVRADTSAECVRVEVEDTGTGPPAGMEEAIFEPYRRAPGTTEPGLGLGLATVKRLVLSHHGKLGVRRAPAGGAVFWFELPRAEPGTAQARSEP